MPWGSYGEMLWQGIYSYDKDTNSHMVFRTGAFCPSIYRSQYNRESPVLIVKEDVLRYVTEANLTGFVLQPVSKEKIVKLDWENWDLKAPEPLVYPSGSMDAEEYVTRRKHNEATAEQIGNLFALIPQKDGLLYCEQERSSGKIVEQSLSGLDIFIDRIFATSVLKFMSVKRLKTFCLNTIPICLLFKKCRHLLQMKNFCFN